MNHKNLLPSSLKHYGIILFDGDCSFCDVSRHLGVPFSALDSVILIEQGRYFIRSTAVLRILQRLPRFSVFTRLFFLIPRPLRDAVYRVAARNRHRWNRKKQTCPVPTPEQQKRRLKYVLEKEDSF